MRERERKRKRPSERGRGRRMAAETAVLVSSGGERGRDPNREEEGFCF